MSAEDTPHRITLDEAPASARVVFGGETIAETTRAIVLREGRMKPVYYIPREDVRMEWLTRTDRTTHCPFKGDASYWTVEAGGRRAADAVWSYEAPFEAVARIRDHMAFYVDRMDEVVTG